MTRIEIVNAILGILRRNDCSADQALQFLRQGIRRVERQLRVPSMERVAHINLPADAHSVTVPGDLLEVIDVIGNGRALDKIPHRDLIQQATGCPQVGNPCVYSRFGTGLYLYPAVKAPGEVAIAYYGTLGPLTADDWSNEGTREFPELLIYAALTYAADFFRHDESDNWASKYDALLTEVQDEATQIDAKGGAMCVQPAYRMDH